MPPKGKKPAAAKVPAAKNKVSKEAPAVAEADLKRAFALFDADNDGFITLEELKSVLSRMGPNLTPWDDEKIKERMGRMDVNGDGRLSLDELGKGWKILIDSSAEGALDAAEVAAKAIKCKWKHFSKDDGAIFGRAQLGKMMKAEAEDWGPIWSDSDFPDYIKEQMKLMTGDEGTKPNATEAQFTAWYPSFEKYVNDVKEADEKAREEKATAKAALGKPKFEGKLWEVPLSKLEDAINAAFDADKVPLLVDVSYQDGEKDSGFSPLETFYSYSSHCYVEMKKLVVQVTMKKEKTLAEAKDEVSKQLLSALKTGQQFVLLLSNAVPPLEKYYDPEKVPAEIFDVKAVKKAMEAEKAEDTVFGPVIKRGSEDFKAGHWGVILKIHEAMRVVVVTKFVPDEYEGYLKDTLPWDNMQPIKVYVEEK